MGKKMTPAKAPANEQLDWDGDGSALESEQTPATALTPLEIRNLPPVEESVNAQDLPPRCSCRLTPGCNGRIITYSTHKRIRRMPEGQPVERVTEQYVKCDKCGRAPVNPRRLIQPMAGARLFDRHKVSSQDV